MNYLLEVVAKIPWLLSILFAASSAVLGDYFGKLWSMNHRLSYYYLALLGYFFSGFFYLPTLLKKGLVITSVLWSVLAIIGFLLIGLFLFKEYLTARQILGVVLGVFSLLLLSF